MKKLFTLFAVLFVFSSIIAQGQTYTWNRTDSSDFQVAANWTPTRTTPAATDVLVFDNGAANTVAYNVPTQTLAGISVLNNTSIRFYSGAAIVLTVGGGTNPVFSVAAGSTFISCASAATNAIVINLTTGSTGSISGNMTLMSNSGTAAHRFQSLDASSVTFSNGSILTFGPSTSGSVFGGGTAPSGLNSIIFSSGSRLIFKSGSNPFGASAPNTVCVFQSGSTLEQQTSSGLSLSNRTFANLEINSTATFNPTGAGTCTMDNLTITDGIFNYNLTGRTNIRGNISVASGKTLTFSPTGSDTIYLNGASNQSISGAGTLTIATNTRFIVTNTAGITLSRNVTFGGELNMQGGNITTGVNTLTLGTSTSALGTLVYTSGTIIGNFERWYAASTVSNVLYPVGTATNYRPVTISYTGAPSTGGTLIVGHTDGTDGSDLALPINDGGFNLDRRSNLYWTLTAANGLTGGTYDMTADGNGQNGINNSTALRLIYSGDAGTTFSAPGTHAAGSGNVASRTGIAGGTYGQHYLAGNSVNNPLPVEMDNFVATTIKNEVILDWATGHEINNDRFEIQRAVLISDASSKDFAFSNYETVGIVKSKGNSNLSQSYKFSDKNLQAGRYAYRLKQIDFNGNYTYFLLNNEVSVNLPTKFVVNQNYPNPFNPVTNISFEMPFDGLVKIVVFDNLGREVKTLMNENVTAGYHKTEFNAVNLPSGIYFYRINAVTGTQAYEKVFKMMLIK